MGKLLQTEVTTLQAGVEATNGTIATVYRELQFEPDGLTGMNPANKYESRSPVSSTRMNEEPLIIDRDVAISMKHDLTKDLIDHFSSSWFHSAAKFPGGTGVGRWINATGHGNQVTALTSSAVTVDAGGALPAGVIVNLRGFSKNADGIRVVDVGSTATSIPIVGGLTAEATPPTGAMVEVCGFQGASGDIKVTVAGGVTTIGSTALDFTTLGIEPLSDGWLGGGTATAPGAFGFATAGVRGFFRVLTVAANAITVDDTDQAWVSDTGTGKTIQVFFGPWLRNVISNTADDLRESHSLELALPGIGSGDVDSYLYATGCGVDSVEIDASLTKRIQTTTKFVGFNVTNTTTRTAGADTGLAVQHVNALATANQIRRLRATKVSDGTVVLDDIQSWKLTLGQSIKPHKKQGTLGNADLIFGKFSAVLTPDASIDSDALWTSIVNDDTLAFTAACSNADCAVLFRLPACKSGAADPKLSQGSAVTVSPSFMTFRDPTYNYVASMTQFPYLPAS